MPFIKISQLTTATAVSATNQFEINQNGASRSAEVSVVAAYVRSSATNVLVLPAGSVTAPSLFPTGDTNTGIFFPAADTIAFTEGGVEAMRIDASGNVGIGTSSPTAYSGFTTVEVGGTSGNAGLFSAKDANGNAIMFNLGGSARFGSTGAFPLVLITNLAERARIDASGNVGIGTSSPGARLDVSGNIRLSAASPNIEFNNGGAMVYGPVANTLAFATGGGPSAPVERARIDTDGSLRVGTTANLVQVNELLSVNGRVGIKSSLNIPLSIWNTNSNGSYIWFYAAGGTLTGTITTDGSTTSYNTSSDYRLKHGVRPLTNGLATIGALKPSSYTWNADNSHGEGFIAHELAEHIPLAVTGEKDAVNEDGSIKPQGVDYSKIVVHLVAAVQELKAEVDALKARITTLETR